MNVLAPRVGTNTLAARTGKQLAVRTALATIQRETGETGRQFCGRVAALAGVSGSYVHHVLMIDKYTAIGVQKRAEEAKAALGRCEVMPFSGNVGPITRFRGWAVEFHCIKLLAESYLLFAQARHDAYAISFLKDLRDTANRAQDRAAMSPTG